MKLILRPEDTSLAIIGAHSAPFRLDDPYSGCDTPGKPPRGSTKSPANQRAKSALSTTAPEKFGIRPQRPCGAALRRGCPGGFSGPVAPCPYWLGPVLHAERQVPCSPSVLGSVH